MTVVLKYKILHLLYSGKEKNYSLYFTVLFFSLDFNLESIIKILTAVMPTELAAMFLSILDSFPEFIAVKK